MKLRLHLTGWLALFLGLTVLSGIAILLLPEAKFEIKEEVIASSSGNPIRVRYVLPSLESLSEAQSHPAVVAVPPYTIPPDVMEILCVELARRSVACAIPNFLGKTREESRQHMGKDSLTVMTQDVLSIINALKALSWIDSERIGVCGHSVGGTVAFLAGLEDPDIRAVIPIGMEVEVDPRRPQNLLLLAGLYDEIRTPSALLRRLREYGIAADPSLDTLYGDFSQGTARQVSVSPTCEHFTETFDPSIIRQMLRWFAQAFEMPEIAGGTLWQWWRKVAAFFFVFSTTGAYAMFMIKGFAKKLFPNLTTKLPGWAALRCQFIPLLALLGFLWLSGNLFAWARPICADLMVSLLAAHLLISVRIRRMLAPAKYPSFQPLRHAGLVALALVIAMFLTWLLTSLLVYVRYPSTLGWYPLFVINMSLLFPLQLWARLVAGLFAETLTGLAPNFWYLALLGSIMLFLDWPVHLLNRIANAFIASLKIRPRLLDFSLSPLKGALLLLVWGILAFLLYRRITEGMLTMEAALAGLALLLRLALLPLLIAWLLLRTRLFRKFRGSL